MKYELEWYFLNNEDFIVKDKKELIKDIDFLFNKYSRERSKREDLENVFPNGKCPYCGLGPWNSLHQGCGALNTVET